MGVGVVMVARVPRQMTDEEIIKTAYDAGQTFGSDSFSIWTYLDDPAEHEHFLRRAVRDGYRTFEDPEEKAKELKSGEYVDLDINLGTRYYGPGYERGDALLIINVAEFFEQRLGAEVWYGRDSDDKLHLFDEEARQALKKHFFEVGHNPYQMGFGKLFGTKRATCRLCHEKMGDFGGGGNKSYQSCTGCGQRVVLNETTGEHQYVKKGDFFKPELEERVYRA